VRLVHKINFIASTQKCFQRNELSEKFSSFIAFFLILKMDESHNDDETCKHGSTEFFVICASTVIAIVAGSLTIAALHDFPGFCEDYDTDGNDDGKGASKALNILLLIQSGLMLLYGSMSTMILIRNCACPVSVVDPASQETASSQGNFYRMWVAFGILWWVWGGVVYFVIMLAISSDCDEANWLYMSVAIVNFTLFTLIGTAALCVAGAIIGIVVFVAFYLLASFCSAMGCTCLDDCISDFN